MAETGIPKGNNWDSGLPEKYDFENRLFFPVIYWEGFPWKIFSSGWENMEFQLSQNPQENNVIAIFQNGKANSELHTPPPPLSTPEDIMYRAICIIGILIGIAFIYVLIKSMKEEII